MIARIAAFFLFLLAALPAQAENERTILVLDGSGSMWGQIEQEHKIVIARKVIAGLLDDLPDTLELGLTVYGHRRKGDCADIESVVAPAIATRDAIRAAVDAINPKGKTPLSAAVLAAAEELKYGEEKATVILVSDGRETCKADPCEIGKQLEKTGVDFTAHVIGFDVSEEKDKAQLRCLAENTGGEFLSAANASELTEALQQVAAPPPPTTIDVTFTATEGKKGPQITEDLIWTITAVESGDAILENGPDAAPILELDQKTRYRAEVLRTSDEAFANEEFTTGTDGPTQIVLVLETPLPDATVSGSKAAPIGLPIKVEWTGPDEKNDYVSIAKPDTDARKYESYVYAKKGSPLELTMPSEPGEYELRYVLSKPRAVLATQAITVEDAEASVTGPETATIGSTVKVEWTGPGAKNDYISVAKLDTEGNQYEHYKYTRDGSPVKLLMPAAPGDYELRYVLGQDRRILATRPIAVEEAEVSVSGPETATVGSTVNVEWIGPDARNDHIAVAKPDAEGSQYEHYKYTRDGSPVKLLMPAAPGDYELRYVLSQDRSILARRSITIEEAEVSVSASKTATVGSTIKVEWVGPDARNDFIAIAKPDDEGSKYENYRYTRHGSPVKLLMPSNPGDYEIRYILSQNKGILARQPISVEAAESSVTGPESSTVGATVKVEWVGPDAQNDFISIAKPDDAGSAYENYRYTRDGSPVKLLMPSKAGTYELRYILSQDKSILARAPITIEEAKTSISGPAAAEMSTTVAIEWEGPDAQNDFIAVAKPDDPANTYVNYSYTRDGSPVKLEMPAAPGDYEIRYILNQDKTILAHAPITIEPATVSLDAKETVKAKGKIAVDWEGPDGSGDFISIALPSMPGQEHMTYRYTNGGSPAILQAPVVPSTYEIRYVLSRTSEVLARKTLTVEAE